MIATRNRQESLANTIRCLSGQQLSRSCFEVIVVDNGSTDLTCDRVTRLQARIPNLRYRFLAEPNVSASRNLGVAEAKGAWLAFTDDDCLPPRNWLAEAARVIRTNPAVRILGGPIFDLIPAGTKAPPGFQPAAWPQSYGKTARFLKPNEYFIECNLLVQKKEFLALGGFDVSIGPGNQRFGFHEGTELQSRISGRHHPKNVRFYDPGIQMRHLVRPARSQPLARVRRSFISGFDHARAFPKKQRHNTFFLFLRAQAATAVLLPGLFGGFFPHPRMIASLSRYAFRCGEMWGELGRNKTLFFTHRAKRRASRSLRRKIFDRLLPLLKLMAAWLGASNVQSQISLAGKNQRAENSGILSLTRLPVYISYYLRPSEPLQLAHPLLAHVPLHRSPGGWRVALRRARVFGPTPAVVTRENKLIEEVSRDWGKEGIQLGILRALTLPPLQEVSGKTFLAASLGGETYFHWLTDVVPMLLEEQRQSNGLGVFEAFLTHSPIKPFHRETFQNLGIAPEKVILLTKRRGYQCAKLTFHTCHHVSGRPPIKTLRRVARFFQPTPPAGRPWRKIAILRSAEMSRPLVHREGILRLLASCGFEEYEPSRDSVMRQAEMFAMAGTIVATHGAALTNLIFCRPETTVVELFSARYVNPCYAHICQQLGLRHIPVLDDGAPDCVYSQLDDATAPIKISPQHLSNVIAKI